ncbi:MAG: hypothetical protein ACFCUN_00550 [Hyphomicrobiaceae bacterium]
MQSFTSSRAPWLKTLPAVRATLPKQVFLQATRGRALRIEHHVERDDAGALLNFVLYALVGTAFLHAVVMLSWESRYLIAAGFFIAVGLMALADSLWTRSVNYFAVVTNDPGPQYRVAVPSLEEARAIAAEIGRRPSTGPTHPASGLDYA